MGRMTADLDIRQVTTDEAGELLTLRRAAFVTEAQQYGDPNIPPLTQTIEELVADLQRDDVVTLGGWDGHRLVGSIRVLIENKKATLGRFAVAPDLQGKGFGTQLLLAILPYLPDGIEEVWVFTGRDSVQNIALYAKHGYEHQHDQTAGDLTYAFLRKSLVETPDVHEDDR
ncbi:MAG: GNAT family N-acetyltransferase [Cellulomonas sp.]|nr:MULTISPECIES: GNAT family N-acetyltransferase [Cellulomonas]KMM45172.1 GCN5 family acetyltransferase [Cellulomonas sp. A375-1]MCR6648181.1 GNAT family N-acetyltransferase [Cellulomonas sp.]MCR6704114.1 GNAT family N-acetyltransferase [Cellulomonas sp.]